MSKIDFANIDRDISVDVQRILEQAFTDGIDCDVPIAYGNKIKLETATGSYVEIYVDASGTLVLPEGTTKTYNDNISLYFGSSSDVGMVWDGTNFTLLPAADDTLFQIGNGTLDFDVQIFGATADDYVYFDASGNEFAFGQDDHGIDVIFYGATSGVLMKWDQANDEFDITATVEMQTDNAIQFRDEAIKIYSDADGSLSLVSDNKIYLNGRPWFKDPNTETLADDKTLVITDKFIHFLDPGGAGRNVVLPAEASSAGLIFLIVNTADEAEDLTIQNDATGTVATVAQNESAFVVCDGVTWKPLVGANT